MTGTPAGERRRSPRRTPRGFAWLVAARLRPGRDVRILDVSRGGALVEAAVRLLPGARIVLHVVDVRGAHTIRGTIVRCRVCALDRSSGVLYRAALAFEQSFVWPDDDLPGWVTEDAADDRPAGGTQTPTGSVFPSTTGEIASAE